MKVQFVDSEGVAHVQNALSCIMYDGKMYAVVVKDKTPTLMELKSSSQVNLYYGIQNNAH